MKIIDLSHLIEDEMPVFPGTEKPILKNACTLKKDGFREKLLSMYSHTGTHIDAPAHMQNAKTLDQLDISHFIGKVTVIDADNYTVGLSTIKKYEKDIEQSDFVLLRTRWDEKWGSDQYFKQFPALSKEGAEFLNEFKLKGFGVDAISVDHIEDDNFTIHHILFKNNLILIENLKNLDQIQTGDILNVLPLKIKDADGSPVRAIAIRY